MKRDSSPKKLTKKKSYNQYNLLIYEVIVLYIMNEIVEANPSLNLLLNLIFYALDMPFRTLFFEHSESASPHI